MVTYVLTYFAFIFRQNFQQKIIELSADNPVLAVERRIHHRVVPVVLTDELIYLQRTVVVADDFRAHATIGRPFAFELEREPD